jgi:TP901 family phage tail tape measure protein
MDKKLRLSLIFEAAGNATNFLRGVGREGDRTARAVKAARERVTELQRATKDVAAFRAMEAGLAGTREKLAGARAEAMRLGAAMDAAENPTRQMSRAFQIATDRVRNLERQQAGQVRGLGELKTKLQGVGVSTDALGAHERRLARDLSRANDELDQQARKMKAVQDRQASMAAVRTRYDSTQAFAGTAAGAGASAIGAGMVAAAPLVAAGNAAVTFQDAMLDVKKVVDFETPQQFEAMNHDVLQLSRDLGLPAEGIAQIIAAAGQAKIARGELKGFALDAGQMGVAFGTTAEDAGQKMATWRAAFGMTQDQVRAFADQVNYLGDNGNATALAISDVVTRVGPLAGVAGAAAAEVAALGSTIVGMGVADEIAATGIKNTMLALTKGEAATKAQQTAFAALGLEATNVAKAMQADAGGTIIDVLERVQKLSPDRQASILTQLFGSESVAAIAPMLSQLDVLKTSLDAVSDSQKTAGSMAAEFENRMSGAKGAMDQAKNGLRGAAIAAGSAFLPAIRDVALMVGRASEHLTAFAQAHPGVVKAAGILLGVVAAGLLIFGGLALAVAAVLGPFALLQLTLTQAGLLFGPLIAGLTGTGAAAGGAAIGVNALLWPVLLVVAAVAALAVGAWLITKNWGRIGPWFSALWEGIRKVVAGAFGLITGYVMNFTPLGFIIRNWSPIVNFLSAAWDMIKQVVGLGIDAVKYYLLAFTPLGMIVRNWSGIAGFFSSLWNGVRAVVGGGINAVKSAIANFQPLNDFKAAFASVWTFLSELPGRLMNAGADAMRGFTRGIRGQRAAVQAAAADAAGVAEAGARKRLDTHSPSRVFASIGQDVMDGFGVGIAANLRAPTETMRLAAAAVVAAGSMAAPAMADAATAPRVQFDDGPRISAPMARGRAGGGAAPVVNITINAAPGMDEEALMQKAIERFRGEMQRMSSGALFDGGDSLGEAY